MEWKLRTDRAVYLQIVDYIRKQIVSGEIGSGDKLLSVRELSGVLNVNPNTVQRAYAELERMGLVDTMRNIGREVTGDMDLIKQSKEELAKEYTSEYFLNMVAMGFSKEEILKSCQQKIRNKTGVK